jgi:hypothetical protein
MARKSPGGAKAANLRSKAKEEGIRGYSKMNKAGLQAALTDKARSVSAPTPASSAAASLKPSGGRALQRIENRNTVATRLTSEARSVSKIDPALARDLVAQSQAQLAKSQKVLERYQRRLTPSVASSSTAAQSVLQTVANDVLPANRSIAGLASAGFETAKTVATGFMTGGARGAISAGGSKIGSGKIALAATAVGMMGYEAYDGYKLDGKKGAMIGAVDGAVAVISGGLAGTSGFSKAIGYDYGVADKAAAKAAEEAKAAKATDAGEVATPASANQFSGDKVKGLFERKPDRSYPEAKAPQPSQGLSSDAKIAAAGVGLAAVGYGANKLGDAIWARTPGASGVAAKTAGVLSSTILNSGGKTALALGVGALAVSGLKLAIGKAKAEPAVEPASFGKTLNAVTAAGHLSSPSQAKQPELKDRSSFVKADGTPGKQLTTTQAEAYRGKRTRGQ